MIEMSTTTTTYTIINHKSNGFNDTHTRIATTLFDTNNKKKMNMLNKKRAEIEKAS